MPPRLLRRETCLQCYYRGRLSLGASREVLDSLLERCSTRTELFVESYAAIGDVLAGRRSLLNTLGLACSGLVCDTCRDLLSCLKLLAAANSVDIEMPGYHFEPASFVDSVIAGYREVRVDEGIREALGNVGRGARLVILLDNAGEAIVDVAAALHLSCLGYKVTLVARSEAYEVDVTEAEARLLISTVSHVMGGACCAGNVGVVGTGSRYPAFARGRVSSSVAKLLESADLVISKGIANLEAYVDYAADWPSDLRVVFAFRAKCPVLAELYGVEVGVPVLTTRAPRAEGGDGGAGSNTNHR